MVKKSALFQQFSYIKEFKYNNVRTPHPHSLKTQSASDLMEIESFKCIVHDRVLCTEAQNK